MTRRPYAGLALLVGMVSWLLFHAPGPARAQLGVFGTGDDPDGGDGGGLLSPRRFIDNPWKRDAGSGDSGPGLTDMFKRFQGGGGAYLRDRAPALADLVDSDASFLPSNGDGGSGGGFNFSIPSFGANVDAGVPDAGPVVAPVVLVARPFSHVTPVTAFQAPHGTVWARLPPASQTAVLAAWPLDPAGKPVAARMDALTREQRALLWRGAASTPGFSQGAAAFILSDVGTPVAARLVALGVRNVAGQRVFYAGFAAPRDGVQPVSPRVVLAASGNVGRFQLPQPPRAQVGRGVRASLAQLAAVGGLPFGRTRPPQVGAVAMAVARAPGGGRVELQVQEANPPAGMAPLCFEATVDARDKLLRHAPWSPVCDHLPVAAVDVDGDGQDEVLWREGMTLVLRRHPEGTVLDMDPPAAQDLQHVP